MTTQGRVISSFPPTFLRKEGAKPGNKLWENSRVLVLRSIDQAGLGQEHGVDSSISRLGPL